MARKEIPEALKLGQEKQRQETYEKIETAARELRDEGRAITRASLRKASGLAASTFSKIHVKKYLLKRWAIGADEVSLGNLDSLYELDEKEFVEILKKVDELRKRLYDSQEKLEKERSLRKKAEEALCILENELKILRGELDIALRRVRILSGKKKSSELVKLL